MYLIQLLQVDCFSFAMFMYELMSVHRPFENLVGRDFGRLSEIIKQLIKDGQRPVLTKKVRSLCNCDLVIIVIITCGSVVAERLRAPN